MDTIWILSSQLAFPISEQLWYLPMWACKDRKEPTIASYVQNRKHKSHRSSQLVMSVWPDVLGDSQKMPKRFERKLGFAGKNCLERNQFYLKWLFKDGDFHSTQSVKKSPELNKSKAKMMLAFKVNLTVDPVAIKLVIALSDPTARQQRQPFNLPRMMHDLKVLERQTRLKRFVQSVWKPRFFKVVSLLRMYIQFYIYLNPPRLWNLSPLTTKNRPRGGNLTPLEGLRYIHTI